MEIKEFDTALMSLGYEFRECRNMTQKVTRSYPEHVRLASEAMEKNMMHADLIIGQLTGMLEAARDALFKAYMDAEDPSI